MSRFDRADALTATGTVAGVAGFGLIYPPLALLFLACVAFGLLALHVIAEARQ